jgi:hypothetical protein
MPSVVTALLISTGVVLGVFAVAMTVRHVQRKRAFGRMVAAVCSSCGKSYGSGILRTMKETGFFWNPAPGYSVIGLRLPSSTYLVTCPHCSVETEFAPAGTRFEQPKEGVRSFTRIVRA